MKLFERLVRLAAVVEEEDNKREEVAVHILEGLHILEEGRRMVVRTSSLLMKLYNR
jgi:hypothetical protein